MKAIHTISKKFFQKLLIGFLLKKVVSRNKVISPPPEIKQYRSETLCPLIAFDFRL